MDGYRGEQYAAAFAEFGAIRRLDAAGGWVLERAIPGTPDRDASGPYPLLACRDWSRLGDDLAEATDVVSLVAVTDPFADIAPEALDRTFNRGIVAFKEHHVVDLRPAAPAPIAPHHRRNARKALAAVEVERVDPPSRLLPDWLRLYDVLIRRHGVRGIGAFSPGSFDAQFALPGLVAFRAAAGGETVGAVLWLVQGDVAYYHLGAYDEVGYQLGASFALFSESFAWFRGRVDWLGLGAGAGVGTGSSGLDRFKAGWATGTRTAYLGRHVFHPDRYDALVAASGTRGAAFFPAYRAAAAPAASATAGAPGACR